MKNKYYYACGTSRLIREFKIRIQWCQMVNLGLEILFWTILIIYLGARLTQTKNGFKQEYWFIIIILIINISPK